MNILKPIVHETVWGGSKLSAFAESTSAKIGHLYSFVDNAHMKSAIVSGPDAGSNLHQWFVKNRARYNLSMYAELPILGALVDAQQTLSIQVHPDDQRARELEGLPFGKSESFYTLEAPTDGVMFNGCKALSVEQMRQNISAGHIRDMLDTMPCEVGDYVYVEGGTMHAATAGSVHFEVEVNCDRTFRFFDFDRVDHTGAKRPLQVEKALACLDVSKRSVSRKYGAAPIEERMYRTQVVRNAAQFRNESEMFAFAVLLKGAMTISDARILPGTAVLLDPDDRIELAGNECMIVWPKKPN